MIFFTALIAFSCSNKVYYRTEIQSLTIPQSDSLRFDCFLTAYDLTEDDSRISTKNDELVLLVYSDTSNNQNPKLMCQDYFIIDSLHQTKRLIFSDLNLDGSVLTFILIEIDTRKNLKQIEPVVRLNLASLISAKKSGDITIINELLGDDDLIGFKSVSFSDLEKETIFIDFKGIHLFDSYNYRLQIKSTPNSRTVKNIGGLGDCAGFSALIVSLKR